MVEIRVRFIVDDDELSRLHGRAFRTTGSTSHPWASQLERHSLTWVGAFERSGLIGFVAVSWDGGGHAFLIDTIVDPGHQRRGIGKQLVESAVEEARHAGCEWVHVDFEEHLSDFYLASCGFRPTAAGVRHLGR